MPVRRDQHCIITVHLLLQCLDLVKTSAGRTAGLPWSLTLRYGPPGVCSSAVSRWLRGEPGPERGTSLASGFLLEFGSASKPVVLASRDLWEVGS